MWTKPAPTTDWPMRESVYDFADRTTVVGKLLIRKATYERVERGLTHFSAFGLLGVRDAGVGFVWGAAEAITPAIEVAKLAGGVGRIRVMVSFSSDDYWQWTIEDAECLLRARTFPKAVWVV